MRGFKWVPIVLLLVACAASAQQTDTNEVDLTIDGQSYQRVRWGRMTTTTITMFHSTGVATIPLWKLPPDLQRKFGYDQQKVESDQRKVAAQARLLNLRRIDGVIYDFSPMVAAFDETVRLEKSEPKPGASWGYSPPGNSGQWTQDQWDGVNRAHADWTRNVYEPWREKLQAAYERSRSYRQYTLVGKVIQVVRDGLLVDTEPIENISDGVGLVFVKNYRYQKTTLDGEHIICPTVMLVSRYQYTDTSGAMRTIPLYDCGTYVQESEMAGEIVTIAPRSVSN